MARKPVEKQKVTETTGHEWDGIKELNTPLPRWWLWTFYLTIIWGIGYSIWYPAWPLLNDSTAGIGGYSSRAEVAAEIEAYNQLNAPLNDRINSLELAAIAGDAEVGGYAVHAGEAVFDTFCIQCHQSGGAGAKGYPALVDDDWLWGGSIEAIYASIKHGIRDEIDPDTRFSEMPAFGDLLSHDEIEAAAEYVLSLSGHEGDAALAEAGAVVFADNCAACHGDAGMGDIELGAPDLTDAIWLFGGDHASVVETITYSRNGMMPAWGAANRLNEAQIRQVATYVHQLGGGE